MNVFELFASISLDTTKYEKGLEDAEGKMNKTASSIKKFTKTFAAVSAGVTTAATAVFAFANKTSQAGDNIDKMSQKLGMSAEKYQEWSHILEHSGTSIDAMQASMKTLASSVESGSDAWEKLGINIEEVRGMDQEDLFELTIKALQNVTNETERTYLAGKLLGRGATELGPLLNTSAEEIERMRQNLHDMGAVMSDETVKNSAAFQDALTDLKAALSGIQYSLAEKLLPAITSIIEKATDFLTGGGMDGIIDGIGTFIVVIGKAAEQVFSFIGGVFNMLESTGLLDTLGNILMTVISLLEPLGTLVNAILPVAAAILEPVGELIKVVAGALDWLLDSVNLAVGLLTGNQSKIDIALGLDPLNPSNLQKWMNGTASTATLRAGETWDGVVYDEYGNKWNTHADNYYSDQFVGIDRPWLTNGSTTVNNYNMTVDVKNVREFNDIVSIAQNQRVATRMGVS